MRQSVHAQDGPFLAVTLIANDQRKFGDWARMSALILTAGLNMNIAAQRCKILAHMFDRLVQNLGPLMLASSIAARSTWRLFKHRIYCRSSLSRSEGPSLATVGTAR